jgi:hypothetical protein
VTVTNKETGVSHDVVTDERGVYKVLYINAGTYTVAAELQGFKKVTYPDNPVRVGEVLRVDVVMAPGVLEEIITVTASSPVINTTTGVTGTTVESKQIASCRSATGRRTC